MGKLNKRDLMVVYAQIEGPISNRQVIYQAFEGKLIAAAVFLNASPQVWAGVLQIENSCFLPLLAMRAIQQTSVSVSSIVVVDTSAANADRSVKDLQVLTFYRPRT